MTQPPDKFVAAHVPTAVGGSRVLVEIVVDDAGGIGAGIDRGRILGESMP